MTWSLPRDGALSQARPEDTEVTGVKMKAALTMTDQRSFTFRIEWGVLSGKSFSAYASAPMSPDHPSPTDHRHP